MELSAGGEDAETLREMNLKTGKFVEGGFVLPRGKQTVAWVDKDTLLIAREWGPGTMSEAGYPITIREWKRGEPLESAREVFRGDVKDNGYGDNPRVFMDGQGHRAVIVERNLSTFAHENYLLLPGGPKKLVMPLKAKVERAAGRSVVGNAERGLDARGANRDVSPGFGSFARAGRGRKGSRAPEADPGICANRTGV